MLITAIQLGYDDEESPTARTQRVLELVAANTDADLIVLPELWHPTGFGYRGWEAAAEPVDGPTMTALSDAARASDAVLHAGSIIERDGDRLWNTSVMFGRDGARLATYRKLHRFGFSTGETTLLQAGDQVVVTPVLIGGELVRVGLATCYDLRFPELFRALQERGAELVIVPAAWPAARVQAWQVLSRARAMENQQLMVAVNTSGTHARTPMGGRSAIIGPDGDVLAQAGEAQQVISAQVDSGVVAEHRRAFPVLADRLPAHMFSEAGPLSRADESGADWFESTRQVVGS